VEEQQQEAIRTQEPGTGPRGAQRAGSQVRKMFDWEDLFARVAWRGVAWRGVIVLPYFNSHNTNPDHPRTTF